MMKIDRKRFLALALGTSLGACGGSAPPAATTPSNTGAPMAAPTGSGTVREMSNDPDCVGFDPTNECVAWGDGNRAEGYEMTNECVRWVDPTSECNAWLYTPPESGD